MSAMNTNRPVSEYNTGEQDLYTGINMVWTSYAEYLANFEAWKTTYTAATGTDQLTALETVKAMPDESQRLELHTSLNKELTPLAENCLHWLETVGILYQRWFSAFGVSG